MADDLTAIEQSLRALATSTRASQAARYFKTGNGEYGEGDIFYGVTVPDVRKVVAQHRKLPLSDIVILLNHEVHEMRLAGIFVAVHQFSAKSATEEHRAALVRVYLDALEAGWINNWDLVDSSAEQLIGNWILGTESKLIFDLAIHPGLWYRRVALMATFASIKVGDPSIYFALAPTLLDDRRDLIQKALGWMAREVGKRIDETLLIVFLEEHASKMGRTALSYATEKLPSETRQRLRKL